MQSSVAFQQYFLLDPDFDSLLSAVSADATRVCICDADGKPQCNKAMINIQVYPRELFLLHIVVVGGDLGTTTGNVYASFMYQNSTSIFGVSSQQHQVIIQNSECSVLHFSVFSNESVDILFLTTQETLNLIKSAGDYYKEYRKEYCLECGDSESTESRHIPLFVNIDFLPCPPGFILLGDPPGCQCHPVLTANSINCKLNHLNRYHKWNSSNIWMQASDSEELLFSTHCPFSYCKPNAKHINLSNPDSQCALNRAGILCSGCKANYSLAIGSSRCIHCPNNNNLALLIFFAAAGVLLVLIIAVLNLTVTQGVTAKWLNLLCKLYLGVSKYPASIGFWQRVNCSQNFHCLAQFRLWNRDMFLPWIECLLKSMVTIHVPRLRRWSFPSRNTLFFKTVYTF